ncbi:hypothetical protein DXG01_001215 [Tephrocybe rancida]|nr:hypothetical protein DXG01_001215 [Tephrocybe rancida]
MSLTHSPSWVPFKREAARGERMIQHLITMPFEHAKRSMAEGTATPSLAKDLLLQGVDEADPSESMALNPDKQRLAQSEIDWVSGGDRLPVISDRESLPYVNALIKETLWHPTLPLGVARRTAKDDVYRSYFIPKDTIVVPNSWAVAFEPNEKYDPTAFIPERFLDPDCTTVDTSLWAFGYRRRTCPGKVLAENSLAVLLPTILAAFDISPPVGAKLEPKFGLDVNSCQIVPRLTKSAELIRMRASILTV